MDNPLSKKYEELREAEQALFNAHPLLQVGKSLAQTLAIPAIAAHSATYLPLAGPVVGAAVGHGTDFIQNHLHGFRESQIAEHFSTLRDSIQPGFAYGMRQRAFDDWATIRSADLLAKSDVFTRPLSGYLAPTAIGKAFLDTAPMVANYVTQLPLSKAIGAVIDRSQAMVSNIQDWIDNTRLNIRARGLKTEIFVQEQLNKMSNKQNQGENQKPVESNSQNVKNAPETVLSDDKTQIEAPEIDLKGPKQQAPGLDAPEFVPVPSQKPAEPVPTQKEDRTRLDALENRVDPDALDYFMKMTSEFGGQNLNTEKMAIRFNGQQIFGFKGGQPDLDRSNLTKEHVEAFRQALSDPKNFKGTLEIKQGNRIVLSIRNGIVYDPGRKIKDLLKVELNEDNEQTQAPETTTQGFYERYSEGVSNQGLKGAKQVAAKALKAGHNQDEIVSMLMENQPTIKQTLKEKGPEQARKQALNSIKGASRQNLAEDPELQQQQQQSQQQEQKQSVSQKV